MRVVELYGVMMIVITISYIIYSLFRNKEDPSPPPAPHSPQSHSARDEEENVQLVNRK